MRLGGGLLAVTGLALVLAWPAHDSARPLTLDGPKRQAKERVAFVGWGDGTRLARIDERTPVVVVATESHVYDKVISNVQETRARGAQVLAVATEGDEDQDYAAVLERILEAATRR